MATCSSDWLGVECLSHWFTMANGLSSLIGVVMGTLSTIVTRLSTLETCHNIGAWSSISSGATIGLGRCKLLVGTRRLKGWPWNEPGWQCRAWNTHLLSVGMTPMGSQESLLWLARRGVVRRADQTDSTRFVYPGLGHEDA